mmetsp:Transcript_2349/g.5058  ORF Transcript_2349/g.5058 Transcript_2349/m.5058 type:complete len:200 (-) Transcript_2349:21-620(-)
MEPHPPSLLHGRHHLSSRSEGPSPQSNHDLYRVPLETPHFHRSRPPHTRAFLSLPRRQRLGQLVDQDFVFQFQFETFQCHVRDRFFPIGHSSLSPSPPPILVHHSVDSIVLHRLCRSRGIFQKYRCHPKTCHEGFHGDVAEHSDLCVRQTARSRVRRRVCHSAHRRRSGGMRFETSRLDRCIGWRRGGQGELLRQNRRR